MGKSLVIVESPAKAKTINRYLGNDFIVKSSIGHIRDLPTSGGATKSDPKARAKQAAKTRKMSPEEKAIYKKKKSKEQLINRMGIDPEGGWEAHYEVLPGKEKVVNELKKLAQKADFVYLATDLDREGEAIAWHLREAIGGDESRYKRVVFNEITKKAISAAFDAPSELDINRVNAQQARRFLDRVVGFMLSPLLWSKVARGLSAGRVQSVAVRLVVEKEKLIRAFIPEEYWTMNADLTLPKGESVLFDVKKYQGKAYKPVNKEQSDQAVALLQKADYKVAAREDRPTSTKPPKPFITSTLQQAASTRLGFGVKKTMMMAQRLYEGGYITYMRTDSTHLSQDAINGCREFISERYGEKYTPSTPNQYSSKAGAQEAHEAIRPSSVAVKADSVSGVDADAVRLYELIWRQFVACQMVPAEYTSTSVTVSADEYELRARGRVIRFDGFTRILPPIGKKEEDQILPDMQKGEALALNKLLPEQHFTKPPARYSEAALVKELEKQGIGRPSTYASIISTIQDRGYVRLDKKRFYAEKMGEIVTERLVENFDDLMDYQFTAKMEDSLDKVGDGKANWKALLDDFYKTFSGKVAEAGAEEGGMRSNSPTSTNIKCPACERDMQIRTGSTGVFLGCSGYALPPKERCKETMNLVPGEEVELDGVDIEVIETEQLRQKHRCKICNTAMDSYLIDEKRKLHICGNNPDCSGYEVEAGQFRIKGYEGPVLECDKCGSEMQLKSGRFGKYFGCMATECKNTRKLLRNGQAAPPKMDPVEMPELLCQKVDDYYLLRDGASGLFLAAKGFPKNRETRAPLLSEILPHKDAIDPKYDFLMSGPVADPDGLPTIIRFSRKLQQHYLQTEVDKKATGWKAHYQEGKWVIEDKRKKAKTKTNKKVK